MDDNCIFLNFRKLWKRGEKLEENTNDHCVTINDHHVLRTETETEIETVIGIIFPIEIETKEQIVMIVTEVTDGIEINTDVNDIDLAVNHRGVIQGK